MPREACNPDTLTVCGQGVQQVFEDCNKPKICTIKLLFCLASLAHLWVRSVYDQAVKTETKQEYSEILSAVDWDLLQSIYHPQF